MHQRLILTLYAHLEPPADSCVLHHTRNKSIRRANMQKIHNRVFRECSAKSTFAMKRRAQSSFAQLPAITLCSKWLLCMCGCLIASTCLKAIAQIFFFNIRTNPWSETTGVLISLWLLLFYYCCIPTENARLIGTAERSYRFKLLRVGFCFWKSGRVSNFARITAPAATLQIALAVYLIVFVSHAMSRDARNLFLSARLQSESKFDALRFTLSFRERTRENLFICKHVKRFEDQTELSICT